MPLLNESDTIHFLCRGYDRLDIDVLFDVLLFRTLEIVRFISGKVFGFIGWLK